MKKTNRFENFIGKILYGLVVGYHHEDYVDVVDDKVVRTPASVWHANALNNQKQRS